MKRTFGILAGIAILGGGAYLGSRLLAQDQRYQPQQYASAPAAVAAAPTTRIAVLNMAEVLKNYQKFKAIQTEIQNASLKYKAPFEQENARLVALRTELQDPNTLQARREQAKQELKATERKMQDLEEAAKNELGKKRSDATVSVYKEIEETVKLLARSRNIELVLYFNDLTGPDAYLPGFLQQKMATPGCIPMYVAPGMDISKDVLIQLNGRIAPAAQAPPAIPGR